MTEKLQPLIRTLVLVAVFAGVGLTLVLTGHIEYGVPLLTLAAGIAVPTKAETVPK